MTTVDPDVPQGDSSVILTTADGLTVSVFTSTLDGHRVVQIETTEYTEGLVRVYINDGAIWNADPETHHHDQCTCVTDFERR